MFTSAASANNMKAATASVAVCAQNMSENNTTTNMSVRTNWRGERSAHISNTTRFATRFETRFSDTSPALFWGECVR